MTTNRKLKSVGGYPVEGTSKMIEKSKKEQQLMSKRITFYFIAI